MLWMRTPEKVYFKKGCMPVALDELGTVMGKKRCFIVTDSFLYKNGNTQPIEDKLDQMGIVHHSNYICYYEAARSELLRSFGSSYADMEEKDGVMMPILEVHSKYLRPAHYDELITVRISLRELPKARITFEYEIYNEAGELLNTGSTVLGFIHRDTRRPCRAPKGFMELLEKNL